MYILVDTSGSITDREIGVVVDKARDLLRRNTVKRIHIVPFDTDVRGFITIEYLEDVANLKEIDGSGGMAIIPALEFVTEKISEGDIVTVITDSELSGRGDKLKNKMIKLFRKTQKPIFWINTRCLLNIYDQFQPVSRCLYLLLGWCSVRSMGHSLISSFSFSKASLIESLGIKSSCSKKETKSLISYNFIL